MLDNPPLLTLHRGHRRPDAALLDRVEAAVERVVRGTNMGRSILEALADAARARGDKAVLLHAQCSAQGFYERLGFTPQGAPFDEVDIAHIEMVRAL